MVMDDAELGAQPEFDVIDYLPDDPMDFALGPEAFASEADPARSEARQSRSPSVQKRVGYRNFQHGRVLRLLVGPQRGPGGLGD